jgi:cold shock protein
MPNDPPSFDTRAQADAYCRERQSEEPGSEWVNWEEDDGRFYAMVRDPALDIRRLELRGDGRRRSGIVRWWRNDKGYGQITADDGEVLFVHSSEIEGDGYTELKDGERVSFVTGTGMADHDRSFATDVRRERS